MSKNSEIGFAAVKITPVGTNIPLGGYMIRYSTGVHDDIFARSLYLTDGVNETLLIALDLLVIMGPFVKKIREKLNEVTGIPKENILVCALHNHSAPDSLGLTGVKGFIKSTLDTDWFKIILKNVIKAGILAKRNAVTSKLGIAQVPTSERLAVNRRHPLKDLNYKLSFLKICDSNDKIRGIAANYAIHATTLNQRNLLITAEYPGYLIKKLKKHFSNIFAIYFNGPCGDINPNLFPKDIPYEEIDFDFYFRGEYDRFNNLAHYGHTKHIGETLADNIIKNINDVNCEKIEEIKVYRKVIKFPVIFKHPDLKFTDKMLARIKSILIRFSKLYNRNNLGYFKYEIIDRQIWIETEIQSIKINSDILIIAVPVELFSEIGEELVKKSPIKNTFIVECANDFIGYVFPLKECEYGGYEIFGIASFVGIAAGTYIKNKIIKMFEEIA